MTAIASEKEVASLFAGFKNPKVSTDFSTVGALSDSLTSQTKSLKASGAESFPADGKLQRLFASASVEMWQRGVHSFMVSAGLTLSSPVWAAVAGYYASHYCMRAHAHLLGRFVLYTEKKVVTLSAGASGYYCALDGKRGADREHKAYWKYVRESALFKRDPLLTVDTESFPTSDGAHRNRANYADHVATVPPFRVFSMEEMSERIKRIAEIELTAVPVPNAGKFPDLWIVQLAAYHRLVGFRIFLDTLLGGENRFWNAHRAPEWCRGIVNFQRAEPRFLPDAA